MASPDLVVAEIAGRQHGVVATRQLHASGIGRTAISLRVRKGRLHRVHRGVYAVGHRALSPQGRAMAAVLAVGNGRLSGGTVLAHWGAVLSHRSAAGLWDLLPWSDPIDVTVPGYGGRGRRSGIRVHRSETLRPVMATLHCGVPVTTPARTIADLRRTAARGRVRRAIRQAEVRGLSILHADQVEGTRSDLELRERGFDVLRFDERQVVEEPGRVAALVRDAVVPAT